MRALNILFLFSASFSVSAFASSLPATAADGPIPALTVAGISSSGNGCPQGSVNYTLTTVDASLGLYDLTASMPRALTPDKPNLPNTTNMSKNCAIHLNIDPPNRYSYRIFSNATVEGYVWLPVQVSKFAFLLSYHWSADDDMRGAASRFIFDGPFRGRFTRQAETEQPPSTPRPDTTSGCGIASPLNVNIRSAIILDAVSGWPMDMPSVDPRDWGWVVTHRIQLVACPRSQEQREIKRVFKRVPVSRRDIIPQKSSVRSAQEVPPVPPAPVLGGTSYGGTGCPQGTVATSLVPIDSSTGRYALIHTFTALELDYSIASGRRKNCQLNVKISVPKDKQYWVNSDGMDVAGHVWLPDEQRRMRAHAQYYWSNDGIISTSQLDLIGPHSGRFTAHGEDPYHPNGTISSCGGEGNLNIQFQAGLTSDVVEWPTYTGPDVGIEEKVWTVRHSIAVSESWC